MKPFQGLSRSSDNWVQGIASQIYNDPALAICSCILDRKVSPPKVHSDIFSIEPHYTKVFCWVYYYHMWEAPVYEDFLWNVF